MMSAKICNYCIAYSLSRCHTQYCYLLLGQHLPHTDVTCGWSCRVLEEAAYFGVSGILEQRGRILMLVDYGGEPPKQRGYG